MAISELTAIVTPPQHPLEAGPEDRWEAVQQSLGIRLPVDFRDFGLTYGTGKFVEQGIIVFNPFAAVFPEQFHGTLEGWRSLKMGEGDREVPLSIYPDVPGLLSWGCDEGGAGMFWFTEGKPENWPILVRGHEEAIYERFDMQLTTFLARIMSLEIVLPHIWLTEIFQDPTRRVFQPFEFKRKDPQLKNVFQLYEENRNKAGFWVQHEIWEASDTDVIVKSIDGKSEGRLFDNTTDSGAASVRVDVYVDGVLNQENLELPIALDPGFRLVPPPKWWVT